jgi:hypothetical protein
VFHEKANTSVREQKISQDLGFILSEFYILSGEK